MKKNIAFCILATTILACSKDKFKTEPQVEIKSFGPSEVFKGQFFTLRAIVRDKEGDLKDSVLLVKKRFNGTTLLTKDTLRFTIHDFGFPSKSEMEIQAVFSYGELRPENSIFVNTESADRNVTMGIIVRDQAGNRSAYVESDPIVLKKP